MGFDVGAIEGASVVLMSAPLLLSALLLLLLLELMLLLLLVLIDRRDLTGRYAAAITLEMLQSFGSWPAAAAIGKPLLRGCKE